MTETEKPERVIRRRPGRVKSTPRFRQGRPGGVWYPDLVGVIQGYPKTQEIWQAKSDRMKIQVQLYKKEGLLGRGAIPDGWGGKKSLIKEITDQAKRSAEAIVDKLIEEGRFAPDNIESRKAIEAAVAILEAQRFTPENAAVPLHGPKDQLAAARLILDFAQRKPTTTQQVTVKTATDWLNEIASEDDAA